MGKPKCETCKGRGTTVPYMKSDNDACRDCYGSGCALCAECFNPRRVASGYAHDGVPLCEGHLGIYYPSMIEN